MRGNKLSRFEIWLIVCAFGFCIVILFAALDWTVGARKGREIQRQLEDELAKIAPHPKGKIVDHLAGYKSGLAVAGYIFNSSTDIISLLQYYESELLRLGWSLKQARNNQDNSYKAGDQERIFQKGDFTAHIRLARNGASDGTTILVEVTWGLE